MGCELGGGDWGRVRHGGGWGDQAPRGHRRPPDASKRWAFDLSLKASGFRIYNIISHSKCRQIVNPVIKGSDRLLPASVLARNLYKFSSHATSSLTSSHPQPPGGLREKGAMIRPFHKDHSRLSAGLSFQVLLCFTAEMLNL